jgi:hypothetical protein
MRTSLLSHIFISRDLLPLELITELSETSHVCEPIPSSVRRALYRPAPAAPGSQRSVACQTSNDRASSQVQFTVPHLQSQSNRTFQQTQVPERLSTSPGLQLLGPHLPRLPVRPHVRRHFQSRRRISTSSAPARTARACLRCRWAGSNPCRDDCSAGSGGVPSTSFTLSIVETMPKAP